MRNFCCADAEPSARPTEPRISDSNFRETDFSETPVSSARSGSPVEQSRQLTTSFGVGITIAQAESYSSMPTLWILRVLVSIDKNTSIPVGKHTVEYRGALRRMAAFVPAALPQLPTPGSAGQRYNVDVDTKRLPRMYA